MNLWRKQKKPALSEGAGRRALFEDVLNYSMDKLKLSFVGMVQQLVDAVNDFFRSHMCAPFRRIRTFVLETS